MATEPDGNEVTQVHAPWRATGNTCLSNDVHDPHGACAGVKPDGTGLRVVKGAIDPWPLYPDRFNAGVIPPRTPNPSLVEFRMDGFFDTTVTSHGESVQLPSAETPVLGIHDDDGRSLVEFRIRDGRLEARYYSSDLDEAARRFADYLHGMKVGK